MMVAYIRMARALGGNLGAQLEEVARIVQRWRTDTARVMAATVQLRGKILILSFVPIVLYLMLHGTLQPLLNKYDAPWEVVARPW